MDIDTLLTDEQIRLLQQGTPSSAWFDFVQRLAQRTAHTHAEVLSAFRTMALQNYQSSFADLATFRLLPADTVRILEQHVAYRDRRIAPVEMISAVLEAMTLENIIDAALDFPATVTPPKGAKVLRVKEPKRKSVPEQSSFDPIQHQRLEEFLTEGLALTDGDLEQKPFALVVELIEKYSDLLATKESIFAAATCGQIPRFLTLFNRLSPYLSMLDESESI